MMQFHSIQLSLINLLKLRNGSFPRCPGATLLVYLRDFYPSNVSASASRLQQHFTRRLPSLQHVMSLSNFGQRQHRYSASKVEPSLGQPPEDVLGSLLVFLGVGYEVKIRRVRDVVRPPGQRSDVQWVWLSGRSPEYDDSPAGGEAAEI